MAVQAPNRTPVQASGRLSGQSAVRASVQRRHRPPAYYRYMAENPAITIHVPKELKSRIDAARAGRPYGEVLRGLFTDFAAAVEKRVEEVRKSIEVFYPCAICGKPLPIHPGSKSAEAVVAFLTQSKWGHVECHQRKQG